MRDFLTALALSLVIEGALWCLLPDAMRKMYAQFALLKPGSQRMTGLACVLAGVLGVWLIRG